MTGQRKMPRARFEVATDTSIKEVLAPGTAEYIRVQKPQQKRVCQAGGARSDYLRAQ